MKAFYVVLLAFSMLYLFSIASYSQNTSSSVGLKSGIGVYSQVPYLFLKNELQSNSGINVNPKFKQKVITGIGYFSSISYQFNTGYRVHIGYDAGVLEQFYNDPLGIYWDNTYRINYQVYYLTFSRQFKAKKFYSSPEIGIAYRLLSDDKVSYAFQITDENQIQLELPSIENRKIPDIGLKIAIDNGWNINSMISLGIRISSDLIGFLPETLLVSPYVSICL